MKLLYCGSHGCRLQTLKRLLIIGEEIAFLDRPSIMFGKWGTVGVDSPIRRLLPAFEEKEVKLSVFSPPSGQIANLYSEYISADFSSVDFRRIFLEGLKENEIFTEKFIQLDSNYGSGTGTQIVEALLGDSSLVSAELSNEVEGAFLYKIDNQICRQATFGMLLIEASIKVTNSMFASDQLGFVPISDDPYMTKLLALRLSSSTYIQETSTVAPFLGLEISKTVIPDQVLEQISLADIVDFRESAKDPYCAWAAEINRLSSNIDQMSIAEINSEAPRIFACEIAPRLVEYRNEMKSISEKMFGDLIKKITKWEIPVLSIAFIGSLSLNQAISAFISGLVPAIPTVVDYYQMKRDTKRKHSIAYLVDLAHLSNS